jgi:hypothetical protein
VPTEEDKRLIFVHEMAHYIACVALAGFLGIMCREEALELPRAGFG